VRRKVPPTLMSLPVASAAATAARGGQSPRGSNGIGVKHGHLRHRHWTRRRSSIDPRAAASDSAGGTGRDAAAGSNAGRKSKGKSKGGPSDSYSETWVGGKYDMEAMGMWDGVGIDGPSCIRLPPLGSSNLAELETLYVQVGPYLCMVPAVAQRECLRGNYEIVFGTKYLKCMKLSKDVVLSAEPCKNAQT